MMRLTVFFTVIAASILIDKVNSLESINIQNFLQALQQQLKQEQNQQRKEQRDQAQVVYYPRDEEDSHYNSVKKTNLDKLLGILPHQKKQRSTKKNQRNKLQNEQDQFYFLARPESKDVKINPDDLLGLVGKNDYSTTSETDDSDLARQSEYSKVYVVLNSEAIKRSKNKDKLNALLSNLLASPQDRHQKKSDRHHRDHQDRHQHSRPLKYLVQDDRYQVQDDRYQDRDSNRYQNKQDRYSIADEYFLPDDEERRDRDQDGRYKGFQVRDWLRRRKMPRSSGETFAKEERIEKKPIFPNRSRDSGRDKPRRLRDRGGGGGGRGGGGSGAGHTAIPYIRQHGDIYEKES